MPMPLIIMLPAADEDLQAEIEQELAAYAEVRPAPPESFDLNQIALVIEVIGGATGIAANAAAIVTFLLMLKDRAAEIGQRSGIRVGREDSPLDVALENADEELLRGMLGID